jgi:SAM-dependent methyltransferase
MTDGLAKRINKKVSFRFCGRDLYFYLSMGLFSSFDIDTGSKQLLKILAEKIDFSKINHLLDTGCGTGVIAISLKKAFPHVSIDALDRDTLALEITSENASLNNTDISIYSGLDTLTVQPHKPDAPFANKKKYDLITTNIPAKAGLPVLHRFFLNGLASLSKGGHFAVVIVEPLRKTAEDLIAEFGANIIFEEHISKHSVFIIQSDQKADTSLNHDTAFPGPYLRKDRLSFAGKNISYILSTVFDLSGFDTIPIPSAVSSDCYAKLEPDQKTFLFWNPGQGHSAVMILIKRFSQNRTASKNCQCVLAGRDILALLISYFNIMHEFPEISCSIVPAAGIEYLSGKMDMDDGSRTVVSKFDFIGIEPNIISGFSFTEALHKSVPNILSPQGTVLVSGKSSDIGRISAPTHLLSTTHSKKTKGFRAVGLSYKNKK